jgi:hypothetical protein
MQNKNELTLASFVLPTGVLDYFTITKVMKSAAGLMIYLDENNLIPQEYIKDKVISKGFYEESSIQDFPIRGKAVYLYVRRRRWFNESTGDYICRDWNLVAKGTRMTQEFASFLKAIAR